MSLLKIFKSSCKSLLASKLTLSEHFPKISKVTLLKVTKIVSLLKISDLHGKHYWLHPNTFHDFQKKKFCTSRCSEPRCFYWYFISELELWPNKILHISNVKLAMAAAVVSVWTWKKELWLHFTVYGPTLRLGRSTQCIIR